MNNYDLLRRSRAWDLIIAEEIGNAIVRALYGERIAPTRGRVSRPAPSVTKERGERISERGYIITSPTPPILPTPPTPASSPTTDELKKLLESYSPTVTVEAPEVQMPQIAVETEGNDEINERILTIDKPTTLLSIEGSGIIREFMFVVNRSDFAVAFYKDGNQIFRKKFSELAILSPFYNFLVATDLDTNQYIVGVSDIRFIKNFKVEFIPDVQGEPYRVTLLYHYRLAEFPEITKPYTISVGR